MEVLGFSITTGEYGEFIEKIKLLVVEKRSSYVCVANVHMLVEAHKDKAFSRVVKNADIVTPDGMPLVWALKILKGYKQDRVAGMDLLPDLLKVFEQNKSSVFFYGGTEELINRTKAFLNVRYPELQIAGFYSPPFRPLTETEQIQVIDNINGSEASAVFVILGCPKQEKWMGVMRGKINACMIGVGGALPVLIGVQQRAPVWMQKSGLEWLYRFFQEPSRLAKRYATTNSIFLWLLLKAWVRQTFASKISDKNITS